MVFSKNERFWNKILIFSKNERICENYSKNGIIYGQMWPNPWPKWPWMAMEIFSAKNERFFLNFFLLDIKYLIKINILDILKKFKKRIRRGGL